MNGFRVLAAGSLVWATLAVLSHAETPATTEPDDSAIAEPSRLATSTLLLDAATAGERIVAVGHFGHVVLSDDGGQSWRQARSVATRVTLTEVFFVDDRVGWAVGHDAVILQTTDAGESWQLQYRNPALEVPLLSVWFEDLQHGLAVGGFGLLMETRDGGAQWTERTVSSDPDEEPHLNHLFPGPGDALFIAAEAGSVYLSRDRGASWERRSLPYSGSLWNGLALPDGRVLVVGMRGNAFSSQDLGTNWEKVETGTDQSLSDLAAMQDGSLVAVGLGGAVVRSVDGGRTFRATTEPDRKGMASLAQGADGNLLLFGEAGVRQRPLVGAD